MIPSAVVTSLSYFCKNEEMKELRERLDEWKGLSEKEPLWKKVEEKKADKIYVIEMIRDSLLYYCLFETERGLIGSEMIKGSDVRVLDVYCRRESKNASNRNEEQLFHWINTIHCLILIIMDSLTFQRDYILPFWNSELCYMAIFWLFHLLQLLMFILNIDYTSDWSILAKLF